MKLRRSMILGLLLFGCDATTESDTCTLHSECSYLCVDGQCVDAHQEMADASVDAENSFDSAVEPEVIVDCRNDGRGCTAPFECQANAEGTYACLNTTAEGGAPGGGSGGEPVAGDPSAGNTAGSSGAAGAGGNGGEPIAGEPVTSNTAGAGGAAGNGGSGGDPVGGDPVEGDPVGGQPIAGNTAGIGDDAGAGGNNGEPVAGEPVADNTADISGSAGAGGDGGIAGDAVSVGPECPLLGDKCVRACQWAAECLVAEWPASVCTAEDNGSLFELCAESCRSDSTLATLLCAQSRCSEVIELFTTSATAIANACADATDGGDAGGDDAGGDSAADDGGNGAAGDGGDSAADDGGDSAAGDGGDSAADDGGDSAAGDGGDSAAGDDGDSAADDGGDSAAGDGGDSAAGDGGDSAAGDGGDSAADDDGDSAAGDGGDGTGSANTVECTGLDLLLVPSQRLSHQSQLMLAVDRSRSVADWNGWGVTVGSIEIALEELDTAVHVGLTLFPNLASADTGDACEPAQLDHALSNDDRDGILATLQASSPSTPAATPTASAIQLAGEHLLASSGGEKYILLITDGAPNCNNNLDGNHCVCTSAGIACLNGTLDATGSENCLDDEGTEAAIAEFQAQGVKTLVLGTLIDPPALSSIACSSHMQCGNAQACSCDLGLGCSRGVIGVCEDRLRPTLTAMARAGDGTEGSDFYEVSSTEELASTMAGIMRRLRSCHFIFDALSNPNETIALTLNGELLVNDPSLTNGWYAEEDVITLYGETCAQLRDAETHQIQARCAYENSEGTSGSAGSGVVDLSCGIDDDCSADRYCNHNSGSGVCELGCRDDRSCETTERCDDGVCIEGCHPEDPTTCPDTQYCNESNRCVDKCETHDDCESNQFCDPTNQHCNFGCRDDEGDYGEPNDTRADAITIPLTAPDQDGIQFGSIEGRVLCENNPDVFRVDVGPGKRLRVTVLYDEAGADGFTLDGVGPAQGCRFMADCAEGLLWTCDDRVCTSPQQVVNNDVQEAMVEYPPLPGTGLDAEGRIVTDETSYYITVQPDFVRAFRYRVDVAVTDATTSCFPDAREAEAGDDVRTNGTEIMVGGTTTRYTFNGTACGMDKDWFKINLNANDGLNIDLRRIDGDDLDLIILPANQSVGAVDATTADSSTLPFIRNVDDNAFLPGGEWHVRVSSTNSESASYELELTHSPSNPCAGGDQGDTIMDASVIALNPGGEYEVGVSGTPEENLNNENTQICNEGASADVDYFCFETGVQEKIEAWLLSTNPMTAAEGEVAVQFTDGSGNLIGTEALNTNAEPVQKARYLGTQAGTYCARVAGVSGRDGEYRLFLSRTESSGEQCALDIAESTGPRNDRASSATVLTEDANRPGYYEFGDGYICDLMRSDEDWYKVNIPEVRSGICVLVDGFDASRADVDLAVYQSAAAAGDNCTAQGQARCDAANGVGGSCVPSIDGATSYCTPSDGSSQSRFDFEMVQLPRFETGDISGNFYIQVGHRDITEGPYTLSVNVNPNRDNCSPDPNETNNSLETAKFLGADTVALCDSWVCNGERDDDSGDWFSIDVPAGEDRTVLITYSDTEGTLHAKIDAPPRTAEDGTILDDPDSDQGSGKHQSTFDAGGRQCFIIEGGTTLNPVHFQTYVSDLISPITWDSNRIDYSIRVFPTDLEANPSGQCNIGLSANEQMSACPLYESWMVGSLGRIPQWIAGRASRYLKICRL